MKTTTKSEKKAKPLEKMHMIGARTQASGLENRKVEKKSGSKKFEPTMTSEASAYGTTSLRRDIAGSIERTDRFRNIEDGLVPFRNSSSIYGDNRSGVDIRDAVILCQKCYWNFALFRNIIDLMTEFSIDEIYYKGGSKQSRAFFEALFKKINIWDLQDKFFREYYRSGNVFIYRFDCDVTPNDIRNIVQTLAAEKKDPLALKRVTPIGDPVLDQNKPMGDTSKDRAPLVGYPTGYPKPKNGGNPLLQSGDVKLVIEPMKMPARYIILNPADINMLGTANFSYGIYYKVLTEYEVSRLRNLQTQEDIEVFNSLPTFTKDQIRAGVRSVYIPLDTKKVTIVFYKKQDYEPFAVPMGYPVLEDINAKIEMRRIDMAISRTMQQMVLLVTAGAEPDKGGINQKNLEALKSLFTNQSVGRVLVADYTTKAEFIVPAIADLLDPKKYEIIDRDINIGLNNVFLSEEKFANQQQKVDIFVKRLEQAKEAFLNNFLIPEIKRIAKSLSFKNYPTPYYDGTSFKDELQYAKLYTQLVGMGVLAPEQGLKAVQSGKLPETDELEPAQQIYKEQRDEGLYVPLVGGPKQQGGPMSNGAGKPPGGAQMQQKVSPIGTSAASVATIKGDKPKMEFSLTKLRENMLLAQATQEKIEAFLKKKHKIKKLDDKQQSVASDILSLLVINEEPTQWESKFKDYCEGQADRNHQRVGQVLDVAANHQLDSYVAGLLYSSRK